MVHSRTEAKLAALRAQFREWGSVLVAYSGGVDSTFLLRVATDELGDRVVAVTARSQTYPEREFLESCEYAKSMGAKQVVIETDEIDLPGYSDNPPNRCYYCKGELFGRLKQIAKAHGIAEVCDGTNADDLDDHRPGRRAAREHGIQSPLAALGFTKAEIRQVSQEMGLPTWDKPARACLASRFPYGERITAAALARIEKAEEALQDLGLHQLRVRYHREIARIEVAPEEFPKILEHAQQIVKAIKDCGFHYVALDLQGYRTGSMNESLTEEERRHGR